MEGGATGTALHTGWQTVGGGYGDMDLEKFFDLVDHRPLMTRLYQNDKGQAGAETDTPLPESGNG
ncbi:hypothetical protein AB2E84_22725 [Escherichia coli]